MFSSLRLTGTINQLSQIHKSRFLKSSLYSDSLAHTNQFQHTYKFKSLRCFLLSYTPAMPIHFDRLKNPYSFNVPFTQTYRHYQLIITDSQILIPSMFPTLKLIGTYEPISTYLQIFIPSLFPTLIPTGNANLLWQTQKSWFLQYPLHSHIFPLPTKF